VELLSLYEFIEGLFVYIDVMEDTIVEQPNFQRTLSKNGEPEKKLFSGFWDTYLFGKTIKLN